MTARDPIDALAEVLRLYDTCGLPENHWADLPHGERIPWMRRALIISDGLKYYDLEIAPKSVASGGTKP